MSRWGFQGYDGEPLKSVMASMEEYLLEQYATLSADYGDLLNGTMWLIDSDGESYALQIISFADNQTKQLLLLKLSEGNVTISETEKVLEGCVDALCAQQCAQEAYDRAKTFFEKNYRYSSDYLFYRISASDRDEVYTVFSKAEGTPGAVKIESYPYISVGMYVEESTFQQLKEEVNTQISAELAWVLNMDYSQIMVEQVGPGHEQDLIRHALVVSWNELDDGGWGTPFSVALTGRFFGGLERGMLLLVQDMEKSPELKRQMESMDHWEVYLNDGGYYELTGYREGVVSMKAQVSWNIALVDGWTTSYVEKLQTLADSGENSQQIPKDTRKAIVEALA